MKWISLYNYKYLNLTTSNKLTLTTGVIEGKVFVDVIDYGNGYELTENLINNKNFSMGEV